MKLGIIGTGRIANRFVLASETVQGLKANAVYNPHPGSAEAFAANHKLAHAYSDFGLFLDEVPRLNLGITPIGSLALYPCNNMLGFSPESE